MALFESYERRINQINKALAENGIASIEEAKEIIDSYYVVNSGNVWNLYNKLLKEDASKERIEWVNSLIPSYPSVVLFALVKADAIPKDTLPTDKAHEQRRYINSAFVMCKDGLAEAIDEIWGNKVTYPDYIESTDFIRFAYDETDECIEGVGIEWT